MNPDLIGLGLGAGLIAALNPCGFALLPGYLALVVHGGAVRPPGDRHGSLIPVARALTATAAMAAGFVLVFGVFALLTVSAASAVQRYLPFATVVIGVVLTGLGAWLLAGHRLAAQLTVGTYAGPSARLSSMFGYGVGYAVASLSCTVGPFLAVIGASSRGGSVGQALAVFAAYAAGFTLVVGALAVAAAMASTMVVDRARRIVPYVSRLGGALLVVVGLYVAYYGLYEIRLFFADGDPRDPVIALAGRIQGTLVRWVHDGGALPWVIALAVLAAAAVGWGALRRRPAGRDRR